MIKGIQPLVTIGVPTYNRPETLKRALDSLVNQTYRNLEIIVSDNCSTDADVQNVVNNFSADARLKFTRQPVNKGLTHNFNFVLKMATGDFFMWLADDDWLDLNYIESCLSFLLEHPDYAAAYGAGRIFNPKEELIGHDVKIDLEHASGRDRMKYFLELVISNGCFSALIPKCYESEMLMRDVIAGDWLIVLRIAFLGKYKMLETTNVCISYGGLSSTTEGLTQSMPTFTRAFPYFNVALNVAKDILFGSKVYAKCSLQDRAKMAKECFLIVFKRHEVKKELKPGIKKFIRYKRREIKFFADRIGKRFSNS